MAHKRIGKVLSRFVTKTSAGASSIFRTPTKFRNRSFGSINISRRNKK